MTAIDLREGRPFRLFKNGSRRGSGTVVRERLAFATTIRAAVLADVASVAVVLGVSFASGGVDTIGTGVLVLCWIIGIFLRDGYDWPVLVLRPLGLRDLVTLAGWLALTLGLLTLVVAIPIVAYLQTILVLVATFWAGRLFLKHWLQKKQAAGGYRLKALVRSSDSDAQALASALAADPSVPVDVVATRSVGRGVGGSLAAVESDLLAAASSVGADTLLLVGPQQENALDLRRLVWFLEAAGLQVAVVPVAATMTAPHVGEIGLSGVPIMSFDNRHLSPESSLRKTAVDRLVALVALVMLSPLLAMIALAVRLDSPGPVLFRQLRVGQGGRQFTMFKFRTMEDGAEGLQDMLADLNVHDGGTLFKIPDDPRMTRVGTFLRRFSLDELPQIYNVLRGQMSLVGPRPPLPSEVANYPGDARRRFLVRPGLTGLWQVSGRSNLDPEESARIDTHYVEHWSPSLDARILAKTIQVVISGDGAY